VEDLRGISDDLHLVVPDDERGKAIFFEVVKKFRLPANVALFDIHEIRCRQSIPGATISSMYRIQKELVVLTK
jgi:hypothetical protein